jgi:hypothetical protein
MELEGYEWKLWNVYMDKNQIIISKQGRGKAWNLTKKENTDIIPRWDL